MSGNPNTTRCGNCGALNPPGATACVGCGKPLTAFDSTGDELRAEAEVGRDEDLVEKSPLDVHPDPKVYVDRGPR